MQKIHKTIIINAPREKVWDTMLGEDTYKEWTGAFNPGSYFEGSWDQGAKIVFLGTDPKDPRNIGGMACRIAENRLHEFISIEFVGEMKKGTVDTASDLTKEWVGGHENYTFKDVDGGTELTIDTDTTESDRDFMDKSWDLGLEKLKELSER